MTHHAIVVTTFDKRTIDQLREVAIDLFDKRLVTEIIETVVNGYYTFLIGPDGSKEGWAQSDEGDEARDKFIEFIHALDYEDGSSPVDFAEVQYGEESGYNKLLRSDSDERHGEEK
ncbi:MAG: hypothetical protein KDD43_00450 [Bdellovibrionales bacterium]|nr:hypothetical protein [Bdellovibrionales bacterium]